MYEFSIAWQQLGHYYLLFLSEPEPITNVFSSEKNPKFSQQKCFQCSSLCKQQR